jgi:hypothetical protein
MIHVYTLKTREEWEVGTNLDRIKKGEIDLHGPSVRRENGG